MISRYKIMCTVIETGSFTKAAMILGYSQSAISQTVKSLENELGTTLIFRKKDGIQLTPDGEQYYPYILSINNSEESLSKKVQEMMNLENSIIRIGTFTSVSRNILPGIMKDFKNLYPDTSFVLRQGEYTSIDKWIKEGVVDFGFVNANAAPETAKMILYSDSMMAVLPIDHPLTKKECVSLHEISKEPFILLDEGEESVILSAFQKENIVPNIEYEVYDDYSIISMVAQNLGVSAMYEKVLSGFDSGISIKPIIEAPVRPVALAWQNFDTMPLASRKFTQFIIKYLKNK